MSKIQHLFLFFLPAGAEYYFATLHNIPRQRANHTPLGSLISRIKESHLNEG